MNGKHFIVAAERWSPWFIIEENSVGSLMYSGIMWNFMEQVSSALNFTFTVVSVVQ